MSVNVSISVKSSVQGTREDFIPQLLTLPPDQIRTAIDQRMEHAKQAVFEQMQKDTEPYVPYKTGNLNQSAYIEPSNNIIGWRADYASFAFNPIAPSGAYKNYTKTVHEEARGFPFGYAYGEKVKEWGDLFVKEVLSG